MPVTSGTAPGNQARRYAWASACTSPSAPSARSREGARNQPGTAKAAAVPAASHSVCAESRVTPGSPVPRARATTADAPAPSPMPKLVAVSAIGAAKPKAASASCPRSPVSQISASCTPNMAASATASGKEAVNNKGPTGPSVITARREGVGGGVAAWPGPHGRASMPGFPGRPRGGQATPPQVSPARNTFLFTHLLPCSTKQARVAAVSRGSPPQRAARRDEVKTERAARSAHPQRGSIRVEAPSASRDTDRPFRRGR